jgi:hypothetical protein
LIGVLEYRHRLQKPLFECRDTARWEWHYEDGRGKRSRWQCRSGRKDNSKAHQWGSEKDVFSITTRVRINNWKGVISDRSRIRKGESNARRNHVGFLLIFLFVLSNCLARNKHQRTTPLQIFGVRKVSVLAPFVYGFLLPMDSTSLDPPRL